MVTTTRKRKSLSEQVEMSNQSVKAERVFDKEDRIPCRSVTSGELLLVGKKSGLLYRWADLGDIEDVEYQDLLYELRSARGSFATYPRFIILDDDFIAQNKVLEDIYKSVYSTADLRDLLLNHPTKEIVKIVPTLPKGIQEGIKGLASTMIETGELDSLDKIKAIDSMFETEFLKILAK